MAARVIKNPRDRLTTILVAPLMSCSARLPVYVLLTAACIPDQRLLGGWLGLQGLVLFSMYVLGVVVAIIVAFILKTTLLKGPTPPFIMELPGFKLPSLVVVSRRMLSQGWDFVRQAGTLIFAVTVLVWAAGYFPHDPEVESRLRESYQQRFDQLADEGQRAELQAELDAAVSGEYLRNSVLGKMGQTIEPFVQPLGWDWKIGISVIASFPAREVVIGTMGVIYNLGGDTDEESATLRDHVRTAHWDGEPDRKVFTIPVALSMMVFFALCAQCASTLVVMKRETQSWRWPLFTFVYMTGIAYLAAMLIYQLASRF
jgi:ferrous iron transport protein B